MSLYNKGLFCGNQAIQWEMNDMAVQPIPSLSTIGRILRRRELTHRRTARYEPKGKKYPELPAAYIGYNTIGTKVIATPYNRDKCLIKIRPVGHCPLYMNNLVLIYRKDMRAMISDILIKVFNVMQHSNAA